MRQSLLETLYRQHIPGAIRESKNSDFSEAGFLNLAYRLIDEFWQEYETQFVRHSTHTLYLEEDSDTVAATDTGSVDALLKTFIAAEIELRIEPGMTIEQKKKISILLLSLGKGFLSCKWTEHAKACFSNAAQLFNELRLYGLADDCRYYESKAIMHQKTGFEQARLWLSYCFAGFGFRPYRLLYCCVLSVALFVLVYMFTEPSWSFFESLTVSSMNYLTTLGFGDLKEVSPLTRAVAIAQGFISLVLNATLFALLVRKWFRS